MPPKASAEEKIIADVKKLSKLEGNKTCAECPERMPGYVNLSHKTFVCTKCAGVLRDLQFKIKGISMSKFTKEDLDEMMSGGNNAHSSVYLAKWPPKDPLPNGQDPSRLKDHIRLKYIEMRWKERDGGGSSSRPASSSRGFGDDAFGDGGFGGTDAFASPSSSSSSQNVKAVTSGFGQMTIKPVGAPSAVRMPLLFSSTASAILSISIFLSHTHTHTLTNTIFPFRHSRFSTS